MTRWVYVDESKAAGYVLAAVTVPEPVAVRRVVRGLVAPATGDCTWSTSGRGADQPSCPRS